MSDPLTEAGVQVALDLVGMFLCVGAMFCLLMAAKSLLPKRVRGK